MKMALLGGSYFLGRGVAEHFLARGHEVHLLNRGSREVPGVTTFAVDRDDPEAMRRLSEEAPLYDVVVDTSCYTPAQAQIAATTLMRKCRRWIHVSSASVYADSGHPPYRESMAMGGGAAWGDYGREKHEADQTIQRLASVPVTVLIPPYLYGRHNYLERETLLWARLLNRRTIRIPDRGDTYLHFITPGEIGAVIERLQALPNPPACLNVASPSAQIRIADYVRLLAEIAKVDVRVEPVDYRAAGLSPRQFFPFRDVDLRLDTSLMAQLVGDDFTRTAGDALSDVFAYVGADAIASMWQGHELNQD